jgi:hypothetical protein
MKNTFLVITFFLVLFAVAYFVFRKKNKVIAAEKPDEVNNIEPSPVKPLEKGDPMPLKVGSGYVAGSQANTLVKDIQDALNTRFKAGLLADGKFGPKTLAALLANGFGGVIYWKQYSQITGKEITVNGKPVESESPWYWPF